MHVRTLRPPLVYNNSSYSSKQSSHTADSMRLVYIVRAVIVYCWSTWYICTTHVRNMEKNQDGEQEHDYHLVVNQRKMEMYSNTKTLERLDKNKREEKETTGP